MLHHRKSPVADRSVPMAIWKPKNVPLSKQISPELEAKIIERKLAGHSAPQIVAELDISENWIQVCWKKYRAANPHVPARPIFGRKIKAKK